MGLSIMDAAMHCGVSVTDFEKAENSDNGWHDGKQLKISTMLEQERITGLTFARHELDAIWDALAEAKKEGEHLGGMLC